MVVFIDFFRALRASTGASEFPFGLRLRSVASTGLCALVLSAGVFASQQAIAQTRPTKLASGAKTEQATKDTRKAAGSPKNVTQRAASATSKRPATVARQQDAAKAVKSAGSAADPKAKNQRVSFRAGSPGAGAAASAGVAAAAGGLAAPTIGRAIGLHHAADPLALRSSVALVMDQTTGLVVYQKNPQAVLPIASITKLMTAMVVIDSGASLTEVLKVTEADRDTERHSSSRLAIGSEVTRADMLLLALMSSENRAAHALGRLHPEGLSAFVAAMNAKARALGLSETQFTEPTGLSGGNVSSARDLARLTTAAHAYPLIREYSTANGRTVDVGRRQMVYRSTNRLVDHPHWDLGLQKTGYISEAGKCLVMQATIDGRAMVIVLLDASGSQARFADAERLRRWLTESGLPAQPVAPAPAVPTQAVPPQAVPSQSSHPAQPAVPS